MKLTLTCSWCHEASDASLIGRNWIVAECPECHLITPFQLEKTA
jgi:hypothetical protein